MKENAVEEFKIACLSALNNFSLSDLRAYGRSLDLTAPTKLKKPDLLPILVSVLAGETKPAGWNKRGAPVKNKYFDPKIIETVEALKKRYFPEEVKEENFDDALEEIKEEGLFDDSSVLVLESNNKSEIEEWTDQVNKQVFVGQLQILNDIPRLLPLNCGKESKTVVVPVETIRTYDLREGDVIGCHTAQSKNALVAREILTVNNLSPLFLKREKFEAGEVCYPREALQFVSEDYASLVAKYLQWILPLYQGQRGCIQSSPKAGKTQLIYEILMSVLKGARSTNVFVLLTAQSPETVWKFRAVVPENQFVYTTYDDTPEKQIFAAEFLLKRAKSFAECGKNVLLLVDSFNALARAYNETEESLGGKILAGGLESKTLQYLRRFFGSARSFKQGGSLTILGTLACDTGNPADDLIALDISNLANYRIFLSDKLVEKRVYPAIDLFKSDTQTGDSFVREQTERACLKIRREFLSDHGEESLCKALESAENYEAFLSKIGVKI